MSYPSAPITKSPNQKQRSRIKKMRERECRGEGDSPLLIRRDSRATLYRIISYDSQPACEPGGRRVQRPGTMATSCGHLFSKAESEESSVIAGGPPITSGRRKPLLRVLFRCIGPG